MTISLDAQTCSIGELFSSENTFRMPVFQRPFSWEDTQAAQLLDDISSSYSDLSLNLNPDDYCFLGQIITSRKSFADPFEVVDGQQRLVTLLTILAVLRDLMPKGEQQLAIQGHIERPGNAVRNFSAAPRVLLRSHDEDEFRKWIIASGGTLNLPHNAESDATERLLAVVRRIKEDISTPHPDYLYGLAGHILNRCYIVQVSTSSTEDAFKLFKSVNSQGQPLTDLDIARGEVIRPLSKDPVAGGRLAEAWDLVEDELGIESLESYVKTVLKVVDRHADTNNLSGSLRKVFKNHMLSGHFIETLTRFINTYENLSKNDLDFGADSARINRVLSCISALPFDDWKPVILLWLSEERTPNSVMEFLRAIDALGLGLIMLGYTSRKITQRFDEVVRRLPTGNVLDLDSPIFLKEAERRKVQEKLDHPIQPTAKFVRPLLLRLNAELLNGEIPTYFPKKPTIEHVLPQKPGSRSVWRQKFPDKIRREKLSKMLGNLTILTGSVNSRASNYDFHRKRNEIFGRGDSNTFPITAQLTKYDDWTEEVILNRHTELKRIAHNVMKL